MSIDFTPLVILGIIIGAVAALSLEHCGGYVWHHVTIGVH
jgi:hypothetical protein